MKLRALDLFCGAGGATRGLQLAGFHVTGVDHHRQPNYVGDLFVHANVFSAGIDYRQFDLVWASPPCQGRTAYKRRPDHVHDVDTDGMIEKTRAMLKRFGVPYIIENVPGAPLIDPTVLCGSMFKLEVRRHRMFETSFPVERPECAHDRQRGNFAQATNRANRRKTCEIGVWRIPLDVQQKAMGRVGWMTREELSESIPPAYAKYLATQFLASAKSA